MTTTNRRRPLGTRKSIGIAAAMLAAGAIPLGAAGASAPDSGAPARRPEDRIRHPRRGEPVHPADHRRARSSPPRTSASSIEVTGPAGGDADAQLTAAETLVAAGVDGLATSVPGESMANGLNDIIESGVPVVQFNLLSTSVDAPYVGERSVESGRILGQQVLELLGGEAATGQVILGQLLPRLPGAREPRRRRAGVAVRRARPRGARAVRREGRTSRELHRVGRRCSRRTRTRSRSSGSAPRTWRASASCRRRTPTATSSPAATTSPRTTWPRSRTGTPTSRSARHPSCRATCRCRCSSTRSATAPSSGCRSSMPAPRS